MQFFFFRNTIKCYLFVDSGSPLQMTSAKEEKRLKGKILHVTWARDPAAAVVNLITPKYECILYS